MQEQEGDNEPAHHARRPMNAFLIFCKRHRSVVRDRYPNLENRSITKILGEWWANLEKEEKACYTGLAKQYKDAFFNANPDFKWYKLPAPPLRTLSSRPRDTNEKTNESPNQELYHETELEKTNNNSTKVDLNKKSRDVFGPKTLSMFTPGKLADEAQMGGLSRLLDTKTETQPNPYSIYKFNSISEHRSHSDRAAVSREDALQNALSETTRMFEEDDKDVCVPELKNSNVIDQVIDMRYEDYGQRTWSDDEKSRSGRSCKGKRYQEFMAVGGLIMNKRQRREIDKSFDEGFNASCSWDPNTFETATDDKQNTPDETADNETKIDTEAYEPDNNSNKTFKAADFDLDAKIAALPSLSLEKFQQRKRDNKRRKKTINLKPKVLGSSHIINSVPTPVLDHRQTAESWREHVIGSQKRKPRKISITRFEINSLVSSHEAQKVSPEIKLATEAPCTVVQNMDVCKQMPSSVDLFALATLAEVASNTSKIDGSTAGFMDALTAKAIDKNASTV